MKGTKKNIATNEAPVVKSTNGIPINGIWGVLLLFVLVSIAYSTYMVVLGTDSLVPKLMVIPQAAFAALIALVKFSR